MFCTDGARAEQAGRREGCVSSHVVCVLALFNAGMGGRAGERAGGELLPASLSPGSFLPWKWNWVKPAESARFPAGLRDPVPLCLACRNVAQALSRLASTPIHLEIFTLEKFVEIIWVKGGPGYVFACSMRRSRD